MASVNNINRQFTDNVNYVAELDNQYYKVGYIERNGIQLGTTEYFGSVRLNVFNKDKKTHTNNIIYSGSMVGNSGLITFLNSMKSAIIALYPDVNINVLVTDGTGAIVDKNINITLSSTTTFLGLIKIDISMYTSPGVVADYTKYSIVSSSNEYIAVLPYLATLDDNFNNAILSVGQIEDEIVVASNNINSIVLTSESINNVNNVGNNINNVNNVGNNITNVNISATHSNEIKIVADDLSDKELKGFSGVSVVANNLNKGIDSEILIAGLNIDNINSNANNIDDISIVANNINSVNTSSDNILKINEVATTIVPVINEILQADTNASIATIKASEALSSATTAVSSANTSVQKASEALASAIASDNSATASLTSENKSYLWANQAENVAVEPDEYSAKHWALKAQGFAEGDSENISYDNDISGLSSTNVKTAIDELDSNIDSLSQSKLTKNESIVASTGTKITYDSNGLVINSTTLSASDIPNIDASKITSGKLSIGTVGSEIIKFDSGSTEGIDSYTFDGSENKTIDIKAGTNITLNKSSGSIVISANDTSVEWNELLNKPTTINGYGITDAYVKSEVYNKVEVQTSLPSIGLDLASNVTAATGQIVWNSTEGTADLGLNGGSTLQIGQENIRTIRNETASLITNGTLCMFAGTIGNSGRIKVKPFTAGFNEAMYLYGVSTQNIIAESDGIITIEGKVRGMDTSGSSVGEVWNDEDILYAKPNDNGRMTNVVPADNELKLVVATVVKAHATNGTLEIRFTPMNENLYYTKVQNDILLSSKVPLNSDFILDLGEI